MILTDTVLVLTAAVIAALAVVVGLTAVALSVRQHLTSRRNAGVRDRMKPELLERLFDPEPDWEPWVDGLSRRERRRVESLLEEYLRKLRGTEYARLCALGAALGLPERAKRNLRSDRKRFRALTWLSLLAEPIDPDRLETFRGDTPRNRAAAARVLHRNDHPDAAAVGTDILVGDGDRSLTAFGMDTLYRLNDGGETPLLPRVEAGVETWNQRLLVQVLLVLRHCNIDDPGRRLGWLPELAAHESPRVRTAAVGVAERHGWRDQLQTALDIESLLSDPEAAVRHDTYLLLASWDDEQSAAWLRWAFVTASRGEDALALVRALFLHSRVDLADLPVRFEPYVDWVRADDAVGRRRRVWGVSAAWS